MLANEQLKIVNYDINTNSKIIAGAGSGKTTTILHKVKYLLEQGIKPYNILLLTFNVSACQNMKDKLKLLCINDYNKVIIKTVDSFACSYYYKFFKKDYIVAISEYSIELLNYLRTKDGFKILKKHKYIFFDEFQDINKIQYDILMEFYKHGSILTVIGDDNQNIYKFRGSSSNFIINIDKLKISKFNLNVNYRSTIDIINFANMLLTHNKNNNISENLMVASNNNNYKLPQVIYNKNYDDCLLKIKNLIDSGEKDIAVLARLNNQIKNFEVELENSKINYKTITDIKNIKQSNVTLSTMHKSKGLEWNIVFIIDYDEEIINLGNQDEELKLFYVAITRAKKELYIYYTKTLSKFILPIPQIYYNLIGNNENNNQNNNTFFNYSIMLSKIIKKIRDKHIIHIREKQLIPGLQMLKCKLYDEVIYPDINDKEFYNTFISLFIKRSLNQKQYSHSYTLALLNPCILDDKDFIIYRKYYNFFKQNLHEFNIKNPSIMNIDLLLKPLKTTKKMLIPILNKDDKKILVNILSKLKTIQKITKLFITLIIITNNNNLDNRLKEENILIDIKNSYQNYKNINLKANKIINDIYNIALATMIYDGHRKYIYSNKYNEFYVNLKLVYKKIIIFKNYFDKLDIETDKYFYVNNILSNIDIYNKSYSELIIIKFNNNIDFFDVLQLYVNAIIEKKIKNISIFLPYEGTFCTTEIKYTNQGIIDFLNSINV
ncbi:UvrD/REP helicase [Hokovirus HKV1]|uniref:DNA 3'-5' helicase n=1 Tax=Hokovirus HKV1 TaxID=1977638 RepID=A0A1V0SET7_9VIRU|nr:UvrD/REP helicase [Hokovirus HKV1]